MHVENGIYSHYIKVLLIYRADSVCALFQVRRVQKYVETLDALKIQNERPRPNPYSNTVVTTKWETFDNTSGSGLPYVPASQQHGGGRVPPQLAASSASLTDWERFD